MTHLDSLHVRMEADYGITLSLNQVADAQMTLDVRMTLDEVRRLHAGLGVILEAADRAGK